jgi:hypothetical protein
MRLLTTLTAVIILGCAAQSVPAQIAQDPSRGLETAAKLAASGNVATVSALADQVLNFPHRLWLPAEAQAVLKQRLVPAEIAYWQGAPGTKETDIVSLINLMCDRLALPAFAKTSPKQVRTLRMQMFSCTPTFIGRGMSTPPMSAGPAIGPRLSPLQAVHLIGTLIDQKFANPAYQVAPAEWDQSDLQTLRARQREAQISRIEATSVACRRELETSVSTGLSQMSVTDGLSLLYEALSVLQID